MQKRMLTLPLLVFLLASFSNDSELTDTFAWMDNTYNPHPHVSGAYGHGHTGWYTRKNSKDYDEELSSASTETFTHDGCQMTIRVEDDRSSALYVTFTRRVLCRSIWPTSIRNQSK